MIMLVMMLAAMPLAGCNDFGTGSVYSDPAGLAVVVGASSMILTNNTSGTVNYFAVEKNLTPLIDWIPRCDGANGIQVGHTKEVVYSGIIGYFRGCELVFYWWHCGLVGDSARVPGMIHSLEIQTPS